MDAQMPLRPIRASQYLLVVRKVQGGVGILTNLDFPGKFFGSFWQTLILNWQSCLVILINVSITLLRIG
jgi:hypothetical protein